MSFSVPFSTAAKEHTIHFVTLKVSQKELEKQNKNIGNIKRWEFYQKKRFLETWYLDHNILKGNYYYLHLHVIMEFNFFQFYLQQKHYIMPKFSFY